VLNLMGRAVPFRSIDNPMVTRLTQLAPTPVPIGGSDAVTSQRFEMKYLISDVEAEEIKSYLSAFMMPDDKARFGHRYMLSSLYLDTPGMNLFWSSNLGEKNRFKLRVRTYSEDPNEPLFCEIKRRMNGIILKKRAAIHREYLPEILAGTTPRPEMMYLLDEFDNLHRFADLLQQVDARPCMHVRYRREAYMSVFGDPMRITFDSNLSCLPVPETQNRVRMNGAGWKYLDHHPVILELKFTDSYPPWLHEFVQRFRLFRDSCAKYVVCIKQMAHEGIWMLDDPNRGQI